MSEAEAAAAKSWINGDESARQMLGRAQASRPSLSLPAPLHRIPLRAGNVVEIAGPSPSAKTQLLIQVTHLAPPPLFPPNSLVSKSVLPSKDKIAGAIELLALADGE